MVRYEDFVDNPLGAMMSLFSFLGLEFTEAAAREVKDHVAAKEEKKNEAYSIYRFVGYI